MTYLKKNKLTMAWGCLLFIFFAGKAAAAQPLGSLDGWHAGVQWQVNAIYRGMDGSWSAPSAWIFTVTAVDDPTVIVHVSGQGTSTAELSIDTRNGQVEQVWLTDQVRGEAVGRTLRIEASSPVYPYLSAIPIFFPHMGYDLPVEGYGLKRSINGRPIPVEGLQQQALPFTVSSVWSDLPDEARQALGQAKGDTPVLRFVVSKNGQPVFKQYWIEALPWAIYTESNDCKAWLVR